jgi:DNA-binding Lrp family transcriptional regulator/predicted nucleotidyltransferase
MFENIPVVDLAIGRSGVRQRILSLLMAEPRVRLHLREIQRRVDTSPGTACRELARLVEAGVIVREAEGAQVYFRAADTPLAAMMQSLLLMAPTLAHSPRPPRIPRAKASRPRTQPSEPAAAAPQVAEPALPVTRAARTAVATPDPETAVTESALAAAPVPAPAATTHLPAAAPDPLGLVVAARLCAAIRPTYGDRLKGMYLYGARAVGNAPEKSDVELMVVLDSVAEYGKELETTSHVCESLSLELGLVVSRVFVSEDAWQDESRAGVAAIRRRAVAI